MASVRNIVDDCLGKSGTLSLKRDVMGVYGSDNPQPRSLRQQLNLIQNRPFVRVALVTVRPTGSSLGQRSNLQQDLDDANQVYQSECNMWVYPVGSRVVITDGLGSNVILDQWDCLAFPHITSPDEAFLFNLGRDMGANIVCYYINSDVAGLGGCAAHPFGRRGFWVGAPVSATSAGSARYTFVHELSHVLGLHGHVNDPGNLNLMIAAPPWTNPPPDLDADQCNILKGDQDVESC